MATDPDWLRHDAQLDQALDLPPAERPAFLATLSPEDRAAVSRLLERTDAASVLDEAEALLPSLLDEADAQVTGDDLPPGTQIGSLEVEARIGAGGMGTVYRALQRGDGFERRVALKVLRPEVATPGMQARFRRERGLLAGLDHDGIARLLDGGTLQDGRPYFAMELVDGVPITRYADAARLSIRDRIQLFVRVLDSVSYAHGQLVVHRDLKPSNVLVGASGVPKLLDFGIARLMDVPDLAGESIDGPLTLAGDPMALTPEYAAPEQMGGAPPTTRADVYAAGAMLYELLSGVRPFTRAEAFNPDRSVPTLASRRVTEAAAAARSTTVPVMRRHLSGDLDSILMHALAPDPEHRYASAERFADDLRRYLEGRPVAARRPTRTYRALAFVRRNRLGVAVASAVAIMSMVALGLILQARTAAQEEAVKARAQATRAEAIRGFLEGIFNAADPYSERAASTPRDLLDRGADDAGQTFEKDPALYADLISTITSLYIELDEYGRADSLASNAFERFNSEYSTTSLNSDLGKAGIRLELARAWARKERFADKQADSLLKVMSPRLLAMQDPDPRVMRSYYKMQGQFAISSNRNKDAVSHYSNAIRWSKKLGNDPGQELPLYNSLSLAYTSLGLLKEYAQTFYTIHQLTAERFGEHSLNAAISRLRLSNLERVMGRPSIALELLNTSLKDFKSKLPDSHSDVITTRLLLATTYEELDQPIQGDTMLRRALNDAIQSLGPDHLLTASVEGSYARMRARLGHGDEAARLSQHALMLWRKAMPEDSEQVQLALIDYAHALYAQGKTEQAYELLSRHVPNVERLGPPQRFKAMRSRILLDRIERTRKAPR